jgi:hypothetical protein
MVRLFSALLAVAAAASAFWLSLRGAEGILPFFQAHALSRWFVPACNLFVVFCLIVAGIKMRRPKRDEDVPLHLWCAACLPDCANSEFHNGI